MAAPQERRVRLLASLYAQFGEAVTWTPASGGAAVPLTARRRGGDEVDVRFGPSEAVAPRNWAKVRKADRPAPQAGDRVEFTDTSEAFKVVGEPHLTHSGLEWLCELGEVRASY